MAGGSLEFRVLGPLDVRRGGRSVAPAGARRRCLLAMLLLDADQVVPVERLIDGVWGESPGLCRRRDSRPGRAHPSSCGPPVAPRIRATVRARPLPARRSDPNDGR